MHLNLMKLRKKIQNKIFNQAKFIKLIHKKTRKNIKIKIKKDLNLYRLENLNQNRIMIMGEHLNFLKYLIIKFKKEFQTQFLGHFFPKI